MVSFFILFIYFLQLKKKNFCFSIIAGYNTIAINQNVDETVFDNDKKKKKKPNDNCSSPVPEPIDVSDLKKIFKGKLNILNRITFSFSDPVKTHSLVSKLDG